MILVIDVSNTNTILGVFEGEELVGNWRLSTTKSRTSDETGSLIRSLFQHNDISVLDIEAVVISSVVPDMMYSLTNAIRKYLRHEAIVIGPKSKTGIALQMENPREMGTDRIMNLVAAHEIYGGPAIVIDYSTATTFDVIDGEGTFLTGITAPGIQVCAEALYERAAKLPKFEIKLPESILTKNTVESMQAGLVISHIGETIYMIEAIKEELNLANVKVVATGGMGRVIDENDDIFDVYDPVLTLQGLRLTYEKNKVKGGKSRYVTGN